ncbi:energy-coupling factor transporter transmembrane component T [Oceanobacillus manasiensis]|uniref:energy-coupling factor transporter transmembrane component T n=1 Tax=Oceanobacillus manasiensis TaxID=586413 RepID=UPI0005A75240|nr:energy-coupling factor transporter transmembrane component T [Oceanobacillus manasiensis]
MSLRGVRSFHPAVMLLYYVVIIIGFMLSQHPIFLMVGVGFLLCTQFLFDKGRQLKSWLGMILTLAAFILILTPIFNRRGNHILFYLFENQVMLEAVIQGIMIAFTLVGILLAFISLNQIITQDRFLYIFARISPQWALLSMLAVRFVPLLKRRLMEIEEIQKVRGFSVTKGSLKERVKNGMLFLQALLTGSLEQSIQTADSMSARGYGQQKRSHYQAFPMKKQDAYALLFILITGCLMIFGWWLEDSVLSLLPVLETTKLEQRECLFLANWALLLAFPVWAEGKEVAKWKYYLQKI